jgi:hypothetical protein
MQDMRSRQRRQPVTLDVPPGSAMLDSWGHARGDWWALVVWWEHLVNPAGVGHYPQACAAWVAARHVHPDPGTPAGEYADIPRITFATDPTHWPAPRGRPGAVWQEGGWFLGILDGTDPLPPTAQRLGNRNVHGK